MSKKLEACLNEAKIGGVIEGTTNIQEEVLKSINLIIESKK